MNEIRECLIEAARRDVAAGHVIVSPVYRGKKGPQAPGEAIDIEWEPKRHFLRPEINGSKILNCSASFVLNAPRHSILVFRSVMPERFKVQIELNPERLTFFLNFDPEASIYQGGLNRGPFCIHARAESLQTVQVHVWEKYEFNMSISYPLEDA